MCDYITLLLPAGSDAHAARAVFDRHRFSFRIADGPRTRYHGWLTFTGALLNPAADQCDCGSALRACEPVAGATKPEIERRAAKLQKRGWSAARTQKWIAQQHEAAETRNQRLAQRLSREATAERSQWHAMLNDLFRALPHCEVVFFIAEYAGPIAGTHVSLRPERRVTVTEWLSLAEAGFELREPFVIRPDRAKN